MRSVEEVVELSVEEEMKEMSSCIASWRMNRRLTGSSQRLWGLRTAPVHPDCFV